DGLHLATRPGPARLRHHVVRRAHERQSAWRKGLRPGRSDGIAAGHHLGRAGCAGTIGGHPHRHAGIAGARLARRTRGAARMIGRRRFGLGAAALALGAAAPNAKTVLRVVPQAEPQVFDPHQSGVNATQENAALIYDTLFSWDADMVPRPQMVETWSKS